MQELAASGSAIMTLDPVPMLLARTRAELAAAFDPARPMRISRAPGRLDVMGGIADYTGSLVLGMPLDRAAAVVLQERADRALQIFSFNLLDEHKPFTFHIPLDALANSSADALRREFAQPGRHWASHLAGGLFVLHEQGYVDLRDPKIPGFNLAVLSTVPSGAGVGSSAALQIATLLNFADHLKLRDPARPKHIADGLTLAALAKHVQNRFADAPDGIMDRATSCLGQADRLLRMVCQPHELQPPLELPAGVRVIGINSNVKHRISDDAYGRTRCAAFMGHKIILETMRELGASAGHEMTGDPMRGYLANLDRDDYKTLFRPRLPEVIRGQDFLDRYGPIDDAASVIEPATNYAVQHATDHQVLEARRVERFAEFFAQAAAAPDRAQRAGPLRRAARLMYASHLSYTMDAMLGAPECDLLTDLVRQRESAGLHGARITARGCGGTVAVLASATPKADDAIEQVLAEYHCQTAIPAEVLRGSGPGAWHVGTHVVPPQT
jgi:L-arabinokinase